MKPETIHSRPAFVAYVQELKQDLMSNPKSWENRDLASFLDALAAWTEDMDGYFVGRDEPVPNEPTWALFAQILTAARVYE